MGLLDFFRTPTKPLSQQEYAEMQWLEREIPRLKELKKRREKLLVKMPGKSLPKSERPEEIELLLDGTFNGHSTGRIGYEKKYWKYRNRYKSAGLDQAA